MRGGVGVGQLQLVIERSGSVVDVLYNWVLSKPLFRAAVWMSRDLQMLHRGVYIWCVCRVCVVILLLLSSVSLCVSLCLSVSLCIWRSQAVSDDAAMREREYCEVYNTTVQVYGALD